MKERVLVINPGSTSTKIAVYDGAEGEQEVFAETLRHTAEELQAGTPEDALAFRDRVIRQAMAQHGVSADILTAVIGRGGMMRPVESGTYRVNEVMLRDLASCRYGDHASNLGAPLAKAIAGSAGVPAFVADPPVVDELCELARLSGLPEISRIAKSHPLNQKAVARRYCRERGLRYQDVNLIVAHMGGGVSVGAHEKGRLVDVNNALGGDGPYSAERAGGLPADAVAELCFSGKYASAQELKTHMMKAGGLMGYLGTNDGREVSARIAAGDAKAELIYRGMAYQIAKEIGALSAALCGRVDGILLTGGFAYDELLTGWIAERVDFIAKVTVLPGEDEMTALAEAALRVLRGEEAAREY